MFLERDLFLGQGLFILPTPIINLLTLLADQFDEIGLGHKKRIGLKTKSVKWRLPRKDQRIRGIKTSRQVLQSALLKSDAGIAQQSLSYVKLTPPMSEVNGFGPKE